MTMQPIAQIPSEPDVLVVATTFPQGSPAILFDHWVVPDLLRRWWPPEATVEPRAGGRYHLAWPSMHWHLRGEYTAFAPGERLAFTWRWDHDPPDSPARLVRVTFAPHGADGTRLTVTHGRYTRSDADRAERQGHLEGWTAFLMMLHQAVGR